MQLIERSRGIVTHIYPLNANRRQRHRCAGASVSAYQRAAARRHAAAAHPSRRVARQPAWRGAAPGTGSAVWDRTARRAAHRERGVVSYRRPRTAVLYHTVRPRRTRAAAWRTGGAAGAPPRASSGARHQERAGVVPYRTGRGAPGVVWYRTGS